MDELVSTTEQNVEVTSAEATEESTSNLEHKREGTKLWENLFFIISVVASIVMMYVQSRSASQEAEKPFAEVIETVAGCTISSHCGPCCLGVLFFKKEAES